MSNRSEVGESRRKKSGGRSKGTPNRATALAREAIAQFVDGNAHRLQGWLDEIAKEEGARTAMECFKDLIEYHVPKLARTEHTGPQGERLSISVELIAPGQRSVP